jgi:hypothetical protein
MSGLFFTLMFSLSAVTGLGLIVYGATLKSAGNQDTPGTGGDIVLQFSDAGEGSPQIFELEKGPDDMDFDEKKHFDPGKHRPEKIESKKAGEGPDPKA